MFFKLTCIDEKLKMKNKFKIDSNISKAETLPSFFYKNLEIFQDLKSKIFLKSWQYIGDDDFLLTYGDGLSDLDISESVDFHKRHGKKITICTAT